MTKQVRVVIWLALVSTLVYAGPALAHHSQAAEFDMHKEITLSGVISKVDWTNPHVYLYVDVKDDKGEVTTWAIESLPTRFYHNLGLSKAMLGEGQAVSIIVRPAKIEGKPLGWLLKITYPDGHSYDFGH